MEKTESQARSSQPIEKHTIVGVLLAPLQVVYSDVVASMERLEQVVRRLCAGHLGIDARGVRPEDLSEDPP